MNGLRIVATAAAVIATAPANASAGAFQLDAPGWRSQGAVSETFAFCRSDGRGRARPAPDVSPQLAWSGAPPSTRSFAVAMWDPDVPTDARLVNVPGARIPADAPRRTFYHWLLIDLPPGARGLAQGADARGVVAHGKPASGASIGRRGVNDYTAFLASDPKMKGVYTGYDGPCPPWNDARRHRYVLTVYALDVPRLPVDETFDGRLFKAAIRAHVLAQSSLTGVYATAPSGGR